MTENTQHLAKKISGVVALLCTYVNMKPEVLRFFPTSAKDVIWEIVQFALWLSAGGYLLLNAKPANPAPSPPLAAELKESATKQP